MNTRQIWSLVAEFLADRITSQEFLATFARQTWGFGDWNDRDASGVAGEVALLLAEYTGGNLPKDALRTELRRLIPGAPIFVLGNSPSTLPMLSQGNTEVATLTRITVGAA